MMKLHDLILYSTLYKHQDGLSEVLGDALLVTENTVYRNIRQSVKRLGAEFVPACLSYQMTPFLQLEKILKNKQIPYTPTLNILKEIESVRPNEFLIEEIPSPPQSYHFHESCHVVADHMLDPKLADGQRDFILKSLLCESFANSAELLATIFNSTVLCSTFLNYNCYIKSSAEYKRNAIELIDEIGFKTVFKITLYSYLYANFLYESVAYKDFKKNLLVITHGYSIPPSLLRKCYYHFQHGFKLNPAFRLVTNSFFLRRGGIHKNFIKALDFNFHNKIKKSPKISQAIDDMCEIIELGQQSKFIIEAKYEQETVQSLKKTG